MITCMDHSFFYLNIAILLNLKHNIFIAWYYLKLLSGLIKFMDHAI